MTRPLTEKIVEAVIKAGTIYTDATEPSHEVECISVPLSLLRTAIQSVLDGEGRVDLNEVERLLQAYLNKLDLKESTKVDGAKIIRDKIGYDLSQLKEGGV